MYRPLRRLLGASRRHIHSQQSVLDAVQEIRVRLSRVSRLSAASSVRESAPNDAKALVADALQPPLASSNDVFFHSERKLTEHEAARLRVHVARRSKGEPLAYVVGRKEFWSLEFEVTQDTLIPRSDTEVLIETLVDQFHPQTPLRILDIGTGSGCLLLSALSEFLQATGVGIDVSPGALAVAEQNARSNNLERRAAFLLRDLETLPGLRNDVAEDEALFQQFDVILCNPPYIPSEELDLIGPDVLEYEPHLALFSDGGPTVEDSGVDPEGLKMYRLLYESVDKLFRNDSGGTEIYRASTPDGKLSRNCLVMEIGSEDQARAVQKLFSSAGPAGSPRNGVSNGSQLRFDRFLFDASGRYRGLLFLVS
ncbi:HemK methyltransferase member 1 [Phytophthora pseudosyringae]|uniref:HemK methyltransferase member 1 n=1 Tax=Phytophthora pseudosyringae TaxID=221518 RepID=A0A8T1V5U1_9STRA|nr:HemK methyltransferase member 1 [Phytophthora pseudosyringae]